MLKRVCKNMKTQRERKQQQQQLQRKMMEKKLISSEGKKKNVEKCRKMFIFMG